MGAYAYSSYTDPPLRERFDPESKVLVLSVGFYSVLDWDNSTTASRTPLAVGRSATTPFRSILHCCTPRSHARFDSFLSVGSGVLGLGTLGSAVAEM